MVEDVRMSPVPGNLEPQKKSYWKVIILFIILIIAIISIFIFINFEKNSSNSVGDFVKVSVGDVEYFKPVGWNEDIISNDSVLFFKPGYLKDSDMNPIHPLSLDKENGQVILYTYKIITPISSGQEKWFRDDDYRWPKTSTVCDDIAFYIYGANISKQEKSGYTKDYPYAWGADLFTATQTNLLEMVEDYDEDVVSTRVMCRFSSKMDDNGEKLEIYSVLYFGREEASDEEIINVLLDMEFFE